MGKVDIWMPVYIGDYLRDTQNLTAEEHGVYLLLLMYYWQKKGEIGSDLKRLAIVAKSTQETTEYILTMFFELVDGNYCNKRADKELQDAQSRSESARANVKKRWEKDTPVIPPYNHGNTDDDTESIRNGYSSSSSSSSSSQLSSKSNSRASSPTTPQQSPEEAHAFNPEPEPEEQHEPGAYPKAIYAAWEAIGAHVYQPASLWTFSNKWEVQVRPHLKGIHSKDVLQALANLKTIYDAPPGTYYWTQKIGVEAFFSKHLEKFLPANFKTDDFIVRPTGWEAKQEAETRAAMEAVYGKDYQEKQAAKIKARADEILAQTKRGEDDEEEIQVDVGAIVANISEWNHEKVGALSDT